MGMGETTMYSYFSLYMISYLLLLSILLLPTQIKIMI